MSTFTNEKRGMYLDDLIDVENFSEVGLETVAFKRKYLSGDFEPSAANINLPINPSGGLYFNSLAQLGVDPRFVKRNVQLNPRSVIQKDLNSALEIKNKNIQINLGTKKIVEFSKSAYQENPDGSLWTPPNFPERKSGIQDLVINPYTFQYTEADYFFNSQQLLDFQKTSDDISIFFRKIDNDEGAGLKNFHMGFSVGAFITAKSIFSIENTIEIKIGNDFQVILNIEFNTQLQSYIKLYTISTGISGQPPYTITEKIDAEDPAPEISLILKCATTIDTGTRCIAIMGATGVLGIYKAHDLFNLGGFVSLKNNLEPENYFRANFYCISVNKEELDQNMNTQEYIIGQTLKTNQIYNLEFPWYGIISKVVLNLDEIKDEIIYLNIITSSQVLAGNPCTLNTWKRQDQTQESQFLITIRPGNLYYICVDRDRLRIIFKQKMENTY